MLKLDEILKVVELYMTRIEAERTEILQKNHGVTNSKKVLKRYTELTELLNKSQKLLLIYDFLKIANDFKAEVEVINSNVVNNKRNHNLFSLLSAIDNYKFTLDNFEFIILSMLQSVGINYTSLTNFDEIMKSIRNNNKVNGELISYVKLYFSLKRVYIGYINNIENYVNNINKPLRSHETVNNLMLKTAKILDEIIRRIMSSFISLLTEYQQYFPENINLNNYSASLLAGYTDLNVGQSVGQPLR